VGLALLWCGLMAGSGVVAVAADEKPAAEAPKPKPKVVVFRLAGAVNESGREETISLGGVAPVSLRTLVERMDKAAKDEAVKAVVLLLDGGSAGAAQVEELRQAMDRVKAAGKPVFAHADELQMGQYVLGAGASRLSVVPTGDVWVTGLYGESPYLRGLLDKLGVQPDYLTCGPYKSAAEIYLRTEPSAEAEAMQNWLLDSQYETFLKLIAAGRKADAEKARAWVDAGPYTAEKAKADGLIDAVEHRQDLEAHLKKEYGEAVAFDRKYGQKELPKADLSSPFGVLKFWSELLGTAPKPGAAKKPAVAIVYVEGAISLGNDAMSLFGEAGASSAAIRKALDAAAADDSVKAVVLRVDSPGGSAVASEIILDATRRVKAKKPLIVSMGNVAGSGGYYVACAADTIYADAGTITGSIGVVGGKFATRALFDKLGVNFKSYSRGQNAGLLNTERPFTEAERAKMQAWMDEIYGVFKGHVTAIRGARLKKPIDELAGGRVYTGQQALELGLVDKIGTLHDAIKEIAATARLGDDYEVRTLPKSRSFFEQLLSDGDEDGARKGLDVAVAVRGAGLIDAALPLLGTLDPARAALVRQALGRLELIQREGAVLMMPEIRFGR
jgi:protease-4